MAGNRIQSRRRFLAKAAKAASGAIVFPYFVPSAVLGRDGSVPANDRITLGIIGLGNMGSGHLRAFLNERSAEAGSVCERPEQRRRYLSIRSMEISGR
ncbi:MAG: hypothetical protein ACYTBV_03815 [Planctomycetota bacterium]